MKILNIEIIKVTDKQVLFEVSYKGFFGNTKKKQFVISTLMYSGWDGRVFTPECCGFPECSDISKSIRSYADLNNIEAITKFSAFMKGG